MKQPETGITVISWLSELGGPIYSLTLCCQAAVTRTLLIGLDLFQRKATLVRVKTGFSVVLGFQGRKEAQRKVHFSHNAAGLSETIHSMCRLYISTVQIFKAPSGHFVLSSFLVQYKTL